MDLTALTARGLADAIAGREVSSREALDALVARVERHNPQLNAVVALDVERARERARVADDALARGTRWGPLHGVPMTVKDVWETEGLVTTSGAPELASHVPTSDAVVVQRVKAAGAVVFGKTNVPLYAGDDQTFNDVYGVTNNPWDVSRTPGGSSGGAAAALAAGFTPLEIGSDIGGSIRMPAHLCGVYGLKPSWGLVPSRGHIPGPPGSLLAPDVNCGGPMARSLEDLRLGLDLLAGPVQEDAVAWRLDLPEGAPGEAVRVAIVDDDPDFPVAAEVRDQVRAFGDRLAGAGHEVVRRPLPMSLREGFELWQNLVLPIIGAGLPDDVFDAFAGVDVPGDADLTTRAMRGLTLRCRDRYRADQRRRELQREWDAALADVDAFVLPVLPVAAFSHDIERSFPERVLDVDGRSVPHLELSAWPGAIGAMLLPVVAMPAGFTPGGLPVGVQVVGPMYGDRRLLRVAERLAEATPGFVPPPAFV